MASSELSMILKKDVEIISLKDMSTVFAVQIISTREVLYCIDENLRMNFEVRFLKDYVKLNEERQIILGL